MACHPFLLEVYSSVESNLIWVPSRGSRYPQRMVSILGGSFPGEPPAAFLHWFGPPRQVTFTRRDFRSKTSVKLGMSAGEVTGNRPLMVLMQKLDLALLLAPNYLCRILFRHKRLNSLPSTTVNLQELRKSVKAFGAQSRALPCRASKQTLAQLARHLQASPLGLEPRVVEVIGGSRSGLLQHRSVEIAGPVKAELVTCCTYTVNSLALELDCNCGILLCSCICDYCELGLELELEFYCAWEIGETHPSITVNNSGLNMGNNLNAGSTKMAKSFGIAGVEVEAVYSTFETSLGNLIIFIPNYKISRSRINDLARGIGIPLRIDNSTLAGNYGHYARVLVDVDLAGGTNRNRHPPSGGVEYIFCSYYQCIRDLSAAPSRTNFDIEVGKSVCNTLESVWTTLNHAMVSRHIISWADAFGDSDEELNDDTVEDEWPPLQVEGSSKPSNEFDGIPYVGQQPNTMIMV
ncbi:hypothetical protein FNV43_RR20309 [Rhamnella rubrinervis]|uniref:Uncharacterized protein n=1 Tax=Rhamnella rubrinervis TaxID=2594499 RepID=A0A8K0E0X0_9ROSA|nr:hypothetical protein FNV43_RR20309 [Rhamnella rubrinervis]